MDDVTVLTFNEPEQAEPLEKQLEKAGIPAPVFDERKLQKYWFIAEPLAGIRLRVDKQNYERAEKLLDEWDAMDGALRDAVHCPQCGSSEVEYPQFTRKFVTPTIYAILCAIGLFEKKFYCQHCHLTWPTKVLVEPKTDILGWPEKKEHGTKH